MYHRLNNISLDSLGLLRLECTIPTHYAVSVAMGHLELYASYPLCMRIAMRRPRPQWVVSTVNKESPELTHTNKNVVSSEQTQDCNGLTHIEWR